MAIKSLREYVAKLEEEGELQVVADEVDWNLEMGAIIKEMLRSAVPLRSSRISRGTRQGLERLVRQLGRAPRKGISMLALRCLLVCRRMPAPRS